MWVETRLLQSFQCCLPNLCLLSFQQGRREGEVHFSLQTSCSGYLDKHTRQSQAILIECFGFE